LYSVPSVLSLVLSVGIGESFPHLYALAPGSLTSTEVRRHEENTLF
jgi:hypothetical protein